MIPAYFVVGRGLWKEKTLKIRIKEIHNVKLVRKVSCHKIVKCEAWLVVTNGGQDQRPCQGQSQPWKKQGIHEFHQTWMAPPHLALFCRTIFLLSAPFSSEVPLPYPAFDQLISQPEKQKNEKFQIIVSLS